MTSVTKEKNEGRIRMFEAILSSPGMQQTCKLSLTLSRQTILLFCRLMEAGFERSNGPLEDDILNALPKEALEELRGFHQEILCKGELAEFYEKLKQL